MGKVPPQFKKHLASALAKTAKKRKKKGAKGKDDEKDEEKKLPPWLRKKKGK